MFIETIKGRESSSENKRLVIFLGPEGSGKTTQAKALSKQLNIPYISTGDIIRERAKSDTGRLGDACRRMIEEHTYLEADLLEELLIERISQEDTNNGLIIDGALRTLEETQDFDETLAKSGKSDFKIDTVFLRVPGWLGVERRLNNPRFDDNPDGILSRLGKFYTNLGERMKIIRQKYNFIQINASGNIEDTQSLIVSNLQKHD